MPVPEKESQSPNLSTFFQLEQVSQLGHLRADQLFRIWGGSIRSVFEFFLFHFLIDQLKNFINALVVTEESTEYCP